jgi:hypothetical protein
MEVHHHSHASHGKKKWTHYFWEFLMLFLAVFCGFFAEYQLEHKIEKDREKKFMQLLVQDLQADIDSVARIKIHRLERYNQSDSLRSILVNGEYRNKGSDLYYFGRNVSRRRFFYSADGTLQQLKNSGSLRLIHNKKIIQKLIAYDVTYRNYLRQLEVEMALVEEYRNTAARIFDGVVFQNLTNQNIVYRPNGNPQLFDSSPASINEFINKLNYLQGGQNRLTELLDGLTIQAMELLTLIKKDYRIT